MWQDLAKSYQDLVVECIWHLRIFLRQAGRWCGIAIQSSEIQPLQSAWSDLEQSGDLENIGHLPFWIRGAAGAAPAARIRALANRILPSRTFSPDYCASLVVTTNSPHCSLSMPGAAGLLLAMRLSFIQAYILFSISVLKYWSGSSCHTLGWVLAKIPCSDLLYYSGSRNTQNRPVRFWFWPNDSLNWVHQYWSQNLELGMWHMQLSMVHLLVVSNVWYL